MKKTRLTWLVVSAVSALGVLAACASHPFKAGSRFPAGLSADPYQIENADPDSSTPDQMSDEDLRDDQKAEKIAVCGKDSLAKDSLADYPRSPTPGFPGYAKVLADPHEALLAKVALIQAATKTIDISTYIYTPDLSSNAYTDELRKAVRRGIDVRVLVDAGGSAALAVKDYYNNIRSLLYVRENELKAGHKPGRIDVVIFRPVLRLRTIMSNLRDRFLNHETLDVETVWNFDRRSHDKILVIDKDNKANAYAIVGGRNIDNSYYGVPQIDGDTYKDMELMVKDDETSDSAYNLANTLDKHFEDLFCAKGNRWIATAREGTKFANILTLGHAPIKDVGPALDGALQKLIALPTIKPIYDRIWAQNPMEYFRSSMSKATLHPASEEENIIRSWAAVFVDPNATYVDKGDNGDSIYGTFVKQAQKAEKTIDLCTPYIFLPPDERDCLKAWVMGDDQRHLRLLSNSVSTSDSALAMETFDMETAPAMLKEGPYRCVIDGELKAEGNFVNHDATGKARIEVYELGRLDNKMFAGNTINGQPAEASHFYGKLHAKFAIVDGHLSWVGSDNLDMRSRHVNSETAVFVDSDQVGADLTTQFNEFASESVHFGDDDWKTMQQQPQVQRRLKTMNAAKSVLEFFPKVGYGD